MTDSIMSPRQVHLRRCSVYSPTLHLRGAGAAAQARIRQYGLDISSSIVSIDIYESVFQNTLVGSLRVRETDGFAEYFPLVGVESILIEFMVEVAGKEIVFRRMFRVHRVGDQTFPKNEERIYTIDLVTPEFINSVSSRILRRFQKGTCLDAVMSILVGDLACDESRLLDQFLEDTAGNVDIVIPNFTPLQAINLFATMALTKDAPSENNFFFFETLQGFHFHSIRKMIVDAAGTPLNKLPTYEVNANKLTGARKIDDTLAYNSIINLHQEQSFDVLEDIASGMLRSRMLHLDVIARKWDEVDTRYTEVFDQTTHLDTHPVYPKNFDQSIDRNVRCFIVPTNVALKKSSFVAGTGEDVVPIRLHESIVLRNRQLREMQHLRTVLDVPGRGDLRAGSVVNLIYPSSRALQDIDDQPSASGPSGPTPFHSGRHLVTSVRHNLTQVSLGVMEYRMHIEACRDSFGSALTGYAQNSADMDGKATDGY